MSDATMHALRIVVIFLRLTEAAYTACKDGCSCEDAICSACGETFQNENVRCNRCLPGCRSCQYPDTDKCIACSKHHVMQNGNCYPCPSQCELCEFTDNKYTCKRCVQKHYLHGFVCEPCPQWCLHCTSNDTCRGCDKSCLPCPNNCMLCTSVFKCSECIPGYYGVSCNETCSDGCMNSICNTQDGQCSCKDGRHGELCDKRCPEHCQLCSNNTECHECEPGYYGDLCKQQCSPGCLDDLCNKSNGVCKACKRQYVGEMCDDCSPGTFGNYCQGICPPNCSSCISKAKCTACREGFFGETCDKRCSSRCARNICNKNSGKCFACISTFDGEFCDICEVGTFCNGICQENCLSCSHLNECTQCKSGYYGKTCELQCSNGCLKDECDSQGVHCNNGCKPMFAGDFCDSCVVGKYGKNCTQNCPSTCSERGCVTNGTCAGCVDGYHGNFCNVSCSGQCLSEKCNQTGSCYDCFNGFFGDRCEHNCSVDCCNNACKRDGSCIKCDNESHEGKTVEVEKIVWISSTCFLAVITLLVIVCMIICKRRNTNTVSVNKRDTGSNSANESISERQIVTFQAHPEASTSSSPNQEIHIYEVPRNVTASDLEYLKCRNEANSPNVYSNPYDQPLETLIQNTSIVCPGQHIYPTPEAGQREPAAEGTSGDVKPYEQLSSDRGVGNYGAMSSY